MNTNTNFILLIIICIVFLLYIQPQSYQQPQQYEPFINITKNYFVDINGKHYIDTLPITLNNIYELYILHISDSSYDKIQFVLTNGNYNTSHITSKISNINNKVIHYQLLHLKSNTPFSGHLKMSN